MEFPGAGAIGGCELPDTGAGNAGNLTQPREEQPPLSYLLIFAVLGMKPKPDSRLFLFSVCLWYSCVSVCVHICVGARGLSVDNQDDEQ